MADEWGYLGAARRIAGDSEQTHVPYHAGAGLLYLPTTLFDRPIDAYHGALVTNALLAALLTLAAWWVAGLAGSLRPPPVRFAAACAVGLYTSFVGYSSLAAPEVAFAALELALVGVFARALRDRRATWWALAGAGCGVAWLLHPRGAGVIAAGAVVAVVALRPLARHLPQLAAFAAPVLAGVVVTTLLDGWVNGTVLDPEQYDSGALLDGLLSGHGLRTFFITAAGQLFYLSAATIGVATLGGLELVRRLRSTEPDRLTALFPLAALALSTPSRSRRTLGPAASTTCCTAATTRVRSRPCCWSGSPSSPAAASRCSAAATWRPPAASRSPPRSSSTASPAPAACTARPLLPGDGARDRSGAASHRLARPAADRVRRVRGHLLVAAARRFGRVVPIAIVGLSSSVRGEEHPRLLPAESRARSQEHVLAEAINRIGAEGAVGCVGLRPHDWQPLPPAELRILRTGAVRRVRAWPGAAVRRPRDQRRADRRHLPRRRPRGDRDARRAGPVGAAGRDAGQAWRRRVSCRRPSRGYRCARARTRSYSVSQRGTIASQEKCVPAAGSRPRRAVWRRRRRARAAPAPRPAHARHPLARAAR